MSDLTADELRMLAGVAGYELPIWDSCAEFESGTLLWVCNPDVDQDRPYAREKHIRWWPNADVLQAIRVVDGMRKRGFEVDIKAGEYGHPWGVEFSKMPPSKFVQGSSIGNLLTTTICRAALKAIEGEAE